MLAQPFGNTTRSWFRWNFPYTYDVGKDLEAKFKRVAIRTLALVFLLIFVLAVFHIPTLHFWIGFALIICSHVWGFAQAAMK